MNRAARSGYDLGWENLWILVQTAFRGLKKLRSVPPD